MKNNFLKYGLNGCVIVVRTLTCPISHLPDKSGLTCPTTDLSDSPFVRRAVVRQTSNVSLVRYHTRISFVRHIQRSHKG